MGSPKVIDLFSGVGGFSLGFEHSGFDVVAAVDNNRTTIESYSLNFPETKAFAEDLSDTAPDKILSRLDIPKEEIDVVIGGPPCQGFSLGGKRDSSDERNDLLLRYGAYISSFEPEYFVMENVPGLVKGESENYLRKFLSKVRSGGYDVIEPIETLNAVDFGVPQYRKRVFVLGYKKGSPPPSYPTPIGVLNNSWDALCDLPVDLGDENIHTREYRGDLGESTTFKVFRGKLGEPSDYVKTINSAGKFNAPTKDGISGFKPVNHTEKVRRRFADVEPGGQDEVSRFYRLNKTEPSNTLRAGSGRDRGTHTPPRSIHPEAPRCITPREAARLQSFPDWFDFHPTKYHSLRQIGNSVPPLLARHISSELLASINDAVVTPSRK